MIRRRGHARGQGLVEFALVLPIFIILLMGLFDLGRLVFAYNTISNASRDGARVAIVNQHQAPAGVYDAEREAAGQTTMLGLDPTDDTQVRLRVVDKTSGAACTSGMPSWLDCLAEMRVQYQWRAITPIIGSLIGPITLSNTTELPIERTCVSSC